MLLRLMVHGQTALASLRSRRGIDGILVALILVGVALVIFGLFYGWFGTMFQHLLTGVKTSGTSACSSVSATC